MFSPVVSAPVVDPTPAVEVDAGAASVQAPGVAAALAPASKAAHAKPERATTPASKPREAKAKGLEMTIE